MSTSIRNVPGAAGAQGIATLNQLRRDLLRLRGGLVFHADASTGVSLADISAGSTLAVQVAFTAACSSAYLAHIASACDATTGQGAHISADATNVLATPAGTDLTSCYARMNEVKAKFNAHGASAVFHPIADGTNVTTAPDATTAGTLATLGNEVKADLNAHFAAAFTAQATVIGPA
jgi:hypothetical protein